MYRIYGLLFVGIEFYERHLDKVMIMYMEHLLLNHYLDMYLYNLMHQMHD